MNDAVTGLILAGGEGRRMGGADKGLQPHRGRPLLVHALARLAPQVQQLAISANRNLDTYRQFQAPVLTDLLPDYAGPLAGLQAGLTHCSTPLLATVPCDSPHFPRDLVARLRQALAPGLLAAVARAEKIHPVFALYRVEVRPLLEAYLAAGGRGVARWQDQLPVVAVEFSEPGAFANLNTLDDLVETES